MCFLWVCIIAHICFAASQEQHLQAVLFGSLQGGFSGAGGAGKMKLIIENTSRIVELDYSIPARIWEGQTDTGIKVICYVTRIAVSESESADVHEQFRKELSEQRKPSAEVQAIPLRLIL